MKAKRLVSVLLFIFCAGSGSVRAAANAPTVSLPDAAKLLLSAPRPEYPLEARQKKLTGRAIVLVKVSSAGLITSASLRQSTGSAILDRAAIASLKRWRFRPGRAFYFEQPVTYNKTGALY
jgi:TonB family protein